MDLERRIDIKENEVDYYKGEMERAGIDSAYSESQDGEPGTNYYDLYMKEKDKVKKLITEQRRLLDLVEQLKLELSKVQKQSLIQRREKSKDRAN